MVEERWKKWPKQRLVAAGNGLARAGSKLELTAFNVIGRALENKVDDGEYILNLQIAPFENDATPSKPILYEILH